MVESIKKLRKICQSTKLKKDHNPYSTVFARKISIYLTKLLLHTSITANQTTLLLVFIGILAGIFLTYGQEWYTLIGALLLQLWYIFDHVDGEIARYRGTESITGKYLDLLSHYTIHPYVFICITFGIYNVFHDITVFIFGFSAALSIMFIDIVSDCIYRAVVLTRMQVNIKSIKKQAKKVKEIEGYPSIIQRIRSLIPFNPFRVPGIIHIILVAAVINVIMSTIVIGHYQFNTMYIVLSFYGSITPFVLIGLTISHVKTNTAEKLYYSLFELQDEKSGVDKKNE